LPIHGAPGRECSILFSAFERVDFGNFIEGNQRNVDGLNDTDGLLLAIDHDQMIADLRNVLSIDLVGPMERHAAGSSSLHETEIGSLMFRA
jgi:hypothetical protein